MKRTAALLLIVVASGVSVGFDFQPITVTGYDPSARGCPTYVNDGNNCITVHEGEKVTVQADGRSVVVHRRAESGWFTFPLKPKVRPRLHFNKLVAQRPEVFVAAAAVSRKGRILLFSPELRERTYPGRPPIYYLSRALRRAGFAGIHTIDVDIAGREKFAEAVSSMQPDLIGGTSLSIQINEAMGLMQLAKQLSPSSVTILGGNHATMAGEYLLPVHHGYLDAVAVGEGLNLIVDVAEAAAERRWESRRSEIRGLLLWDGSKTISTGTDELISPDEYLPDLVHDPSYNFSVFNRPDGSARETFQLMSCLGCEDSCRFCEASANPSRRGCERRMSLNTVGSLLREGLAKGFEAIYFDDDTFTRDREYAITVSPPLQGEQPRLWVPHAAGLRRRRAHPRNG